MPGRGTAIAIDTEFVSVEVEDTVVDADGNRRVRTDARQALARVSAVDERTGGTIIDDYILPTESIG